MIRRQKTFRCWPVVSFQAIVVPIQMQRRVPSMVFQLPSNIRVSQANCGERKKEFLERRKRRELGSPPSSRVGRPGLLGAGGITNLACSTCTRWRCILSRSFFSFEFLVSPRSLDRTLIWKIEVIWGAGKKLSRSDWSDTYQTPPSHWRYFFTPGTDHNPGLFSHVPLSISAIDSKWAHSLTRPSGCLGRK
jgi:hypothetical protein